MKNELIVMNKPKATISEDIRTLRTNLDFSLTANNEKVVMITSSNPSEGKSFISSNLGTCFAQNNTVIISIFLQSFPVIYSYYGKTASHKTLFTVILFLSAPLISFSFRNHNHKKVSLII